MKKLSGNKLVWMVLFTGVLAVSLYACKKDGDGSPGTKPGNLVADNLNPGSASGGALLTLTGSGLGDIRRIIFDKDSVPAQFYTTLNTDNAIVFRVPDTVSGGPQNIVFINGAGKTLLVPFTGLAYPNVMDVSNYNFKAGTRLTLTGVNLEEVNKVVIDGTTDEATIVSKEKKKLVITMPATTVNRAKLVISNTTGASTTTQEFVYTPNQFVVFDDDWGKAAAYGGDVQSWSFDVNLTTTATAIAPRGGSTVLQADYTKGGGGVSAFMGADWGTPNRTFSQFFKAAFITFWAYGNGDDANLTLVPDNPWAGDAWGAPTATGSKTITVTKGKWTYFRIPADFIIGDYSRLNIKLEGTGDIKKSVFFDDILLVK